MVDESVRPSALVVQAVATAELGRLPEAPALPRQAVAAPDAHPDVFADAAYLACMSGDQQRAESLEHRLRRSPEWRLGASRRAYTSLVRRES